MKGLALIFISLLASGISIKIQHTDQISSVFHYQSSNNDQADAGIRYLQFIEKDNALKQAMKPGNHINSQQLKKVKDFMIEDKYFQNKLIEQVQSKPEKAWIKNISRQAKLRYLRIVNTYPEEQMRGEKLKQIEQKLFDDKQIGPALKKVIKYDSEGKKIPQKPMNIGNGQQYVVVTQISAIPYQQKKEVTSNTGSTIRSNNDLSTANIGPSTNINSNTNSTSPSTTTGTTSTTVPTVSTTGTDTQSPSRRSIPNPKQVPSSPQVKATTTTTTVATQPGKTVVTTVSHTS